MKKMFASILSAMALFGATIGGTASASSLPTVSMSPISSQAEVQELAFHHVPPPSHHAPRFGHRPSPEPRFSHHRPVNHFPRVPHRFNGHEPRPSFTGFFHR